LAVGGGAGGMGEEDSAGRVLVFRGAISAEAHLIDELSVLASAGVEDPGLFREPVLVVTPSRSLREHLSARLVERHGRAVAGISIKPLDQIVDSILAAAGESAASDKALFPALIRQIARSEASLRESLDGLSRGYAPVVANVADLLDAGLQSVHAEAAVELIGDQGRGALVKRAEAVVRVAARASEQLEEFGIGHLSTRVRRACELIDRDPERVLPARAVFVFGFADATGLQTDLIELLLRRRSAQIILDRPADPEDPLRPDPGVEFADRFSERMQSAVGVETVDLSEPQPTAEVRVFVAPGLEAEVRHVGDAIREQLDAGIRPERIGVVTRNLDFYRATLRSQFCRLGIPFSGVDARDSATPADRRRIVGLQTLLRAKSRVAVDLWLDLLFALPSGAHSANALCAVERSDLRAAFHALGIARIGDLRDFDASGVSDLPSMPRRGLVVANDGTPSAPRRELPPGRLAAAASAARHLAEIVSTWPDRAALSVHMQRLQRLVTEALCWPPRDLAREALFGPVDPIVADYFEIDQEEFGLFLDARLAQRLGPTVGGAGGGVAILSVAQARSRTFDRLFLIGLNREVFPRPIGEDPLLPDGLRSRLRAVLPDLPILREGYDEERYLFAQLLSSSPNVAVSYPAADEDGRRRPPSPLLERLRAVPHTQLEGVWQPVRSEGHAPLRPAYEHAQIAGLCGTRDQFAVALRVAVDEQWASGSDEARTLGAGRSDARAAARAAVLDELGAHGSRRHMLGPYFGFAGEISEPADPRRAPLYITGAENLTRCAWQSFLIQQLRVEALPDALAELPSAGGMIVGNLVHRVLQKIVTDHQDRDGSTLDQVARRSPISIPWPDADRLQDLLKREAIRLLRADGIRTPGFERVLIDQARACLGFARTSDWPVGASDVGVLGAEVDGSLSLQDSSGDEREVHFRVDRVDRTEAGLRLIDYKTGKAAVHQKQPASRRTNLLKNVSHGKILQAAAYAMGGSQLEDETAAEGRYLYVGVDTPEHARVTDVESDDEECSDAFLRTLRIALDARDRGSFTPRLIDASARKEPPQCTRCTVKDACLRGDSGSRMRLEQWAVSARGTDAKPLEAERAALALWDLGVAES
jgi:hypothetical protein